MPDSGLVLNQIEQPDTSRLDLMQSAGKEADLMASVWCWEIL